MLPVIDKPATLPRDLGLTARQVEVLALMMQGKSNKAICRALNVAEQTAKKHVTAILKVLNVSNRTEAVIAIGALGSDFRHAPSATTKIIPLAPALPDKPSIVVLPFANLSGDPYQDYFADGMVEDITIALGRLPGLFVIGSIAAFAYKGRPLEARQVGTELGVRYVLGGSVRKEGNRLRIAAQLTDALHGGQIWADRIEAELDRIFEMQDRVAAEVSTMIAPALRTAEISRIDRKPTETFTAYDLFLQASRRHSESFEQNQQSLRLLYRAIEIDPRYGAAYGLAALCHYWQKVCLWIPPDDPRIAEGVRLAHLAADIGKSDSEALWMAAQTMVMLAGETERALPLIEESLKLNSNSPAAWQASSMVHSLRGDCDLAMEHAARAQLHNPLDPLAFQYLTSLGFTNFWAGHFEESARIAGLLINREPRYASALRLKAATSGLLDRLDEGREAVQRLLAISPWLSIKAMRAFYDAPLKQNRQVLENMIEGLRRAGLPEGKPP